MKTDAKRRIAAVLAAITVMTAGSAVIAHGAVAETPAYVQTVEENQSAVEQAVKVVTESAKAAWNWFKHLF